MTISGRKVIACVPFGRERYVRVLLPYLLQEPVDEVRLWLNTDEPADLAYATGLMPTVALVRAGGELNKSLYPAKELGFPGSTEHFQYNDSVCRFYPGCVEPNTVYIKCDDDICYFHPGAIRALVEEVIEHRDENYAVLANVFNVPHTTLLHQKSGSLDKEPMSTGDPRCPVSCTDGPFAEQIHRQFLVAHKEGTLDKFVLPSHNVYGRARIGVMAWTGENFAKFGGQVGPADEKELTQRIPQLLGMRLRLAGNALCSHYAFSHQRGHLDTTDILKQYEVLTRRS